MSDTEIQHATESDLLDVALLHCAVFSDHFLGKLSPQLISRFYASFLKDAMFIVARNGDDRLQGFLLGGPTETLDLAREVFVRSERLKIALEVLTSPSLWTATLSRLKLRLSPKAQKPSEVSTTPVRLLSIAVSPDSKGRGVAAQLTSVFESLLKDGTIYGLSVEDKNARAVAFYEKMGMTLDGKWGSSVFFYKKVKHGANSETDHDV